MHFGFALDLSDIDLLNVDLLDQRYTHLDLFVSKTSWRRLQDMSSRRLQDIFSRRLQDMSSRCLQRNNFLSSKMSLRRFMRSLQDVFKTSSQDVFKMSWKTKNWYAEDVLKTSSRHVLKTSLRRLEDQQMFAGSVV